MNDIVKELEKKNLGNITNLKSYGFKIKYIWENDWINYKNNKRELLIKEL